MAQAIDSMHPGLDTAKTRTQNLTILRPKSKLIKLAHKQMGVLLVSKFRFIFIPQKPINISSTSQGWHI